MAPDSATARLRCRESRIRFPARQVRLSRLIDAVGVADGALVWHEHIRYGLWRIGALVRRRGL